ncbi:MAG: DUF1489 domain-containing protein [Caulobacteraceae bacterium]
MALHLIKLVVGLDTVEELEAWRRQHQPHEPEWKVRTRQSPKRADELVNGGSIYRVFKGAIMCRQTILAVDTIGEGRESRCEITVSPEVVRVAPTARRPFQGWRYLDPKDAPPDLSGIDPELAVPPELARQLREIGAW